jgi:hypothetical protein
MTSSASTLDIEKFRKVHVLMTAGATDGERSAAKARAEAMAKKAGMTLSQAASSLDGIAPSKPANLFEGFDDWMEEKEPGYKARCAAKRAEKDAADAIRRREVLSKYGTEQSLFARTKRERQLAAAVHDIAEWRDWTDEDGTVHTYADRIDGKMDFWNREALTDRVYAAVVGAYPVPSELRAVLSEYEDWRELEIERALFCEGEWNHHREVEARIAVLKDELDNRPASSWDDTAARMDWWEENLSWDFTPSLDEERLRKERIAADLLFLRHAAKNGQGLKEPTTAQPAQNGRRTNADKAADVKSLLQSNPELSDREISRRVGVSPQTVGNWRARLAQTEMFQPEQGSSK